MRVCLQLPSEEAFFTNISYLDERMAARGRLPRELSRFLPFGECCQPCGDHGVPALRAAPVAPFAGCATRQQLVFRRWAYRSHKRAGGQVPDAFNDRRGT
ncbi:hypothetical protein MRX96_032229 [Rhipicephalus microplus]